MDHTAPAAASWSTGLPRTRGDGPYDLKVRGLERQASRTRGDKPALRSRGRALRKSASEQRGASGTTPAATARTVAEPEEPAETRRSDPEEAIGPGGERAEP